MTPQGCGGASSLEVLKMWLHRVPENLIYTLSFPWKVVPDDPGRSLPAWAVLCFWHWFHLQTPASLQVLAPPDPCAGVLPDTFPATQGHCLHPSLPEFLPLPPTSGNHGCALTRQHIPLTAEGLSLLAEPFLASSAEEFGPLLLLSPPPEKAENERGDKSATLLSIIRRVQRVEEDAFKNTPEGFWISHPHPHSALGSRVSFILICAFALCSNHPLHEITQLLHPQQHTNHQSQINHS